MVPSSCSAGTPCSSPATMKKARIGITAPFIVIDDRHLVERNAVEQDFHILNAVDCHARLADIADHARMVAVIAPMRREIEGDRQAPSAPRPDCGGKRRSILPRWKSPHIAGSSKGGPHTSTHAPRA